MGFIYALKSIYMDKEIQKKFEELEEKIKDLSSESKSKEELLKIHAEAQELFCKIDLDRKRFTLNKMIWLSDIMTSTIGGTESLPSKPLFPEDELYPFKAKMLELLKQI